MFTRAFTLGLLICAALLVGCAASVEPVIPTPPPSITAIPDSTTEAAAVPTQIIETRTPVPTVTRAEPTGGPSPTSLIGPTRTAAPAQITNTPRPNPNAPRIEFFTADIAYVYPGDPVTLFWSVRGADRAAIYLLDDEGQRSRLWNVDPSGSLVITTNRNDRGSAEFLLTVDNGDFYVEQLLAVPLLCANSWFFQPVPQPCPGGPPLESEHVEQVFEGGRMIYVQAQDLVYVLFADGRAPGWTSFTNRYVEGESLDADPNFVPPPDRFQPTGILGLVWRGSDAVRNRLRLALGPEIAYEGALQDDGAFEATIYLSSSDGSILQLDPNGVSWGILAVPP